MKFGIEKTEREEEKIIEILYFFPSFFGFEKEIECDDDGFDVEAKEYIRWYDRWWNKRRIEKKRNSCALFRWQFMLLLRRYIAKRFIENVTCHSSNQSNESHILSSISWHSVYEKTAAIRNTNKSTTRLLFVHVFISFFECTMYITFWLFTFPYILCAWVWDCNRSKTAFSL